MPSLLNYTSHCEIPQLSLYQSSCYLNFQEDKLEKRETELRQLSARLETTKSQLETLRKVKESETHGKTKEASLTRAYELEKRQLQSDLKQLEAQYAHLENLKRGIERENQRLQSSLSDKDQEIQVSDYISNITVLCQYLSII